MSTEPTTQRDRISYSYGLKVPGPEEYSSVHVSVSYASDVADGESAEEALQRARDVVHAQCERDLPDRGLQLSNGVREPAQRPQDPRDPFRVARRDELPRGRRRPEDEPFDYEGNDLHYKTANIYFDNNKVMSDKRRQYFVDVILKDARYGEIGRLIKEEVEAFRNKGRRA